jgi:chromate transporter
MAMSGREGTAVAPKSLSALELGWIFLQVGMTAFGGLGATLALMHRELVNRRRVLTTEQMTEALGFTKPLPGSTVVQVVSYLGYRLGGWHGSALATVAFLTPPMVSMALLAHFYGAVSHLPAFSSVVNGLVAAVVGLMLTTTYRLGRTNTKGATTFAIALVAFAAVVRLKFNAALVVVVAGLFGLLTLMPPSKSTTRDTGGE